MTKRLLIVHGSPFEPRFEYVYPNSPTLSRMAETGADIVVLGHTHYKMAERIGGTLVVNPGSAGKGRDPRNAFQLSYAVLETGKGEAGIVPEIDARRITADLVRALGRHASAATLAPALAEAAERIADSALATRERRRPLPDPRASESDETAAPSPRGDRPTAPKAGGTAPAAPPHRSVMPGAYALAILVVVGLALRQRQRSVSAHRRTEVTRRG